MYLTPHSQGLAMKELESEGYDLRFYDPTDHRLYYKDGTECKAWQTPSARDKMIRVSKVDRLQCMQVMKKLAADACGRVDAWVQRREQLERARELRSRNASKSHSYDEKTRIVLSVSHDAFDDKELISEQAFGAWETVHHSRAGSSGDESARSIIAENGSVETDEGIAKVEQQEPQRTIPRRGSSDSLGGDIDESCFLESH